MYDLCIDMCLGHSPMTVCQLVELCMPMSSMLSLVKPVQVCVLTCNVEQGSASLFQCPCREGRDISLS